MKRKLKYYAIHAYKYNGFLYRKIESPLVLYEDEHIICLYSTFKASPNFVKKHKEVKLNNLGFLDKVWFFFKDKWYNIIISINNCDELKYSYYVNIASPFVKENNIIKYIDFDLDYRINLKLQYKLVDVKEYKENQVKFKYPKQIKLKIEEAKNEVVKLIQNKWFAELFKYEHIYDLNEFLPKFLNYQKAPTCYVRQIKTKKSTKAKTEKKVKK